MSSKYALGKANVMNVATVNAWKREKVSSLMVLIVTRYRYWDIMSENIMFYICKYYTSANMLVVWFQICDNTACERDKDGRLCGGCGICRCGKCDCEPCKLGDPNIIGDPGDTCECSLKKCRAPDDPRICSGNGVCDCDTCDCNDRYTGNSSFANNISTAIKYGLLECDPPHIIFPT